MQWLAVGRSGSEELPVLGWECVPERSAAVARSQLLPWEAKNPQ